MLGHKMCISKFKIGSMLRITPNYTRMKVQDNREGNIRTKLNIYIIQHVHQQEMEKESGKIKIVFR